MRRLAANAVGLPALPPPACPVSAPAARLLMLGRAPPPPPPMLYLPPCTSLHVPSRVFVCMNKIRIICSLSDRALPGQHLVFLGHAFISV
jgi:hypothetical protein